MAHPLRDALALLSSDSERSALKHAAVRDFPGLAGKSWTFTRSKATWTLTLLDAPVVANGALRLRIGVKRGTVAKAWNDDGILILVNPPTTVEDPAGDIADLDSDGVTVLRTRREDILAALRQAVLDAITDGLVRLGL